MDKLRIDKFIEIFFLKFIEFLKPVNVIKIICGFFIAASFISGCKKTKAPLQAEPVILVDSIPKSDSTLFTLSGPGGVDDGQIFLALNTSSSSGGHLLILDKDGNIIKEKDVGARVDNFQKWVLGGQTYYSYLLAEGDYAIGGPGTEEGYDIICDTNFNEISRAKFISDGNIDNPDNDRLDVHDFILLAPNHYMAISAQLQTPTNIPDSLHASPKTRVVACLIEEINNGQVVFKWNGADYPEFYGESVENNNFSDSLNTIDYMHMNSLCIDPNDNNIICSFRNLNEIIKINRTTGAIMWRLGGKNSDFPLTANQEFLRQHYARFTDNGKTLIFLDNGDSTLRPYSRILEFQLDESNKTVSNFKAYNIPDNFVQYAGSVKKANGYYFIGGGSANYALQVNYTNDEVYLRINQNYSSYRALKY